MSGLPLLIQESSFSHFQAVNSFENGLSCYSFMGGLPVGYLIFQAKDLLTWHQILRLCPTLDSYTTFSFIYPSPPLHRRHGSVSHDPRPLAHLQNNTKRNPFGLTGKRLWYKDVQIQTRRIGPTKPSQKGTASSSHQTNRLPTRPRYERQQRTRSS